MRRWPVVIGSVVVVLLACLGVAYAVSKPATPPAPQVMLADPAMTQALNRLAAAKEAEVEQMKRQNDALEQDNRLQEARNQTERDRNNSFQNMANNLNSLSSSLDRMASRNR